MPRIEKPQLPDATELIGRCKKSAATVQRQAFDELKVLNQNLNAAIQIYEPDKKTAKFKGPLAGLPISVKETYGLAGENITAGSKRMPPISVSEDAVIVKKIKKAGAFILCRGNVPEFAMTGETTNVLYGRTNNALDVTRTAGGSSGGEGALVGSGAVAFALRSDILGSIRIPAAFNGVVGFKPASEAIDKTGTWPSVAGFTDSFLSLGPLARSVRDIRLIYNLIAKKPLKAGFAEPKKLRLILPANYPNKIASPEIATALEAARRGLLDRGFTAETADFSDVGQHFLHVQKIIIHDFEEAMLKALTTAQGQSFSKTKELINQLLRRPQIDDGLFKLLFLAPIVRPKASAVEKIIASFQQGRDRYYDILGDDGILLLPTLGFVAPKHGGMNRLSLKPGVNKAMTTITFPNYMNLPAISIPSWKFCDSATGLPGAIMAIAAPGAEENLLNSAKVLEALLN